MEKNISTEGGVIQFILDFGSDSSQLRDSYDRLKKEYPTAVIFFRDNPNYFCLLDDAELLIKNPRLDAVVEMRDEMICATIKEDALDICLPGIIRSGRRVAIIDQP